MTLANTLWALSVVDGDVVVKSGLVQDKIMLDPSSEVHMPSTGPSSGDSGVDPHVVLDSKYTTLTFTSVCNRSLMTDAAK